MSTYLLDVNVLIALIDPAHVHADRAHNWFSREGRESWLTCPLTETGAVRIVSSSGYAYPTPPAEAISALETLTSQGHHTFIPDSASLLDSTHFAYEGILTSKQLTDTYLVALAAAHDSVLAAFDTRISTAGVRSARKDVFIIP